MVDWNFLKPSKSKIIFAILIACITLFFAYYFPIYPIPLWIKIIVSIIAPLFALAAWFVNLFAIKSAALAIFVILIFVVLHFAYYYYIICSLQNMMKKS